MSGAAGGRVVRPRMKFSQRPMPPKFAKGREWRDSDGVSLKWLLANGFRAKAEEVRRKWAVGKMVKGTRAQTMAGAVGRQFHHYGPGLSCSAVPGAQRVCQCQRYGSFV